MDGLNLDDVLCFKQERKVAKDNSFSLDGVTYAIPREHNMVAFKVKLHIHPGIKIRVWYKDEFLCKLTHIIKEAKDKRRIMFFDPPCIFRLGGGMNRVEMDAVDRYPRGLRRPQESRGRRVPIFKEPEQLSGPDKPFTSEG